MTDGNVHVGDLLQLPLDGRLDIVKLLVKRLGVSDWRWESTDSVKNWTKDNWDLLNEGVSGEKHIELLGPLLDLLLVLVELLQGVKGRDFDFGVSALISSNTECSGLINMLLIANHADLQAWSWHVLKLDGTSESLVLLWIVILEGNLKLNGLQELSFLALFLHLFDAVDNQLVRDLRSHIC